MIKQEINIGFDCVSYIPQQVLDFDGFFTSFHQGVEGGIFAMSQQSVYILLLAAAAHPMSVNQMKTQRAPLLLETEEARASREGGM